MTPVATVLAGGGCLPGALKRTMQPTSIAVLGTKTDRSDIGLLKRSSLGRLREEEKHCGMVAIPTVEDEDAKRLHPRGL
jgi:transposase